MTQEQKDAYGLEAYIPDVPDEEFEDKPLTKSEILETLEGMEILSVQFEGCVGIYNGKIVQMGEVICANPTKAQLSTLLDEAFGNEFGDIDISDLI